MTRRKLLKNRKTPFYEIDVTILLDIMIVVLLFIIQNYNSTGLIMSAPKGVDLPHSTTQNFNSYGVNIQVAKYQIWVDEKEVLNTAKSDGPTIFDEEGRRILPLYERLVKIKGMVTKSEKLSPKARPFSGVANLIIDKSMRYSYVKKVIYTCNAAGFNKFNLITTSALK